MMDKEVTDYWRRILEGLGLAQHPRHLMKGQRRLQSFILDQLSSDPAYLPDEPDWEKWYHWHEKHGTALFQSKVTP